MNMHELHRRALEAARKFFQIEAELLDLIQKIDACKGFRELGHASLFSYAVGELKLSESVALNLINVARKAVQVPALKTEIQSGNLSVCKARKIVPVLNVQNQAEWIEKARTLPTRVLEREIAKVAPTAAFPERVRYATENRLNLSLSVDEKTMEAIRRVQDLECQRQGRAVTLEETLATMSACYIDMNDPVEKAKRALGAANKSANVPAQSRDRVANAGLNRADVTWHTKSRDTHRRKPLLAEVENNVTLRDGGRCTATNSSGQRCESRRWLHVHHLRPISNGGSNALENLTTLCSGHHRLLHAKHGLHGDGYRG